MESYEHHTIVLPPNPPRKKSKGNGAQQKKRGMSTALEIYVRDSGNYS